MEEVIKLNAFQKEVWEQNYKAPEDATIFDTWKRIAMGAAMAEEEGPKRDALYGMFLGELYNWRFVPGGRIMANIGVTGREATTLMNCYAHAPKDLKYKDPDSIKGIYDMLKAQAQTLKSEGGYGMNFSWIRPAGMYVKGIGGRTPGVLKFMELWDKSSEIITAGSEELLGERQPEEKLKTRKGAQMAILDIWHPGIKSFIVAKQTPGRLTRFNLSVGITKGFMEAVESDSEWNLIFPDTEHPQYRTDWQGDIEAWLAEGLPVNTYHTIPARELWNLIMTSTYTRNEPGVLFLDVANELNPLKYGEKIMTSNPCLTGDTLVKTSQGLLPLRVIIEEGVEKFKVWSFDTQSGKFEWDNIVWGGMTRENAKVYQYIFSRGDSIKATKDHKVWIQGLGEFITFDELYKAENGLKVCKRDRHNIEDDLLVRVCDLPNEDVYDITTEKNHNFFANNILVHNCVEVTMSTGVCNLGSINLTKYIHKDEKGVFFDIEEFKSTIPIAIRFLDNINDISVTPLPEYKKSMKEKRRVGLGVMGLGSVPFMLGIRYGSQESIEFIKSIYKAKAEAEIMASAMFGQEKGSFELFDADQYFVTGWWKGLDIDAGLKKNVETQGFMRNSHRSANAPTGNSSIYAGVVSGGIEPVFMKEYVRWSIVSSAARGALVRKGFKFPDVSKGEWFETDDLKFTMKGGEEILKGELNGGSYELDKGRGLVKGTLVEDYGWAWVKENYTEEAVQMMENRNIFDTTTELSVEDHISTLKEIAQYVDMSSSKTINIPSEYPYEDFKNIYMDAWKNKIKGITTYRAGTMAAVLEEKGKITDYQNDLEEMFTKANGHVIKDSVKLPQEYYSKGFVRRDKNSKKWYFNVAFVDKAHTKPFALFINTNCHETTDVAEAVTESVVKLLKKKRISTELIEKLEHKMSGQSNVQKIARAISMALRHNIKSDEIVKLLNDYDDGFSTLLFHIKKVLSQFIKNGTKAKGVKCTECGDQMVYQEGCALCMSCGMSKC